MLKRILGIFKRDKADFSNEELVFQKRVAFIIEVVLALVMMLSLIVDYKYEKNDILSQISDVTYYICLVMTISIHLLKEAINDEFKERRKKQREQRRKQWKEKQKQKILDAIDKKQVQTIQFTEFYNDLIVEFFLRTGEMQIANRQDYLELFIQLGKMRSESIILKKDNMSKYFRFDDPFIFDEDDE